MSYSRKQNEKKRLDKLYKNTTRYLHGAYFDEKKNRIIRYSKSGIYRSYKFRKKQYHKKLRRAETLNKKEYDLMWELY